MAFDITITAEAESHWRPLPVRDQRLLRDAIRSRLTHRPMSVAKAVKRLRPNPLAELELRVGDLRVLYNVGGQEVVILAIGRTVGTKWIVKGEEFHAHQDNPPQSPRGR